jgi:NAD(P)-dependent dehydrogenase (short-subunit alcohol dehydrogenase family)
MALPAEVAALHGAVDGIVNNAGIIHPFRRIEALEFDAIERVVRCSCSGRWLTSPTSPAWAASCRCRASRSTARRRPR